MLLLWVSPQRKPPVGAIFVGLPGNEIPDLEANEMTKRNRLTAPQAAAILTVNANHVRR